MCLEISLEISLAGGSLAEWHIAFRGGVKRGLRTGRGAIKSGHCAVAQVAANSPERASRATLRASTIDGGDMAIEDDDRPRKKVSHDIGQDLSLLSVEELTERVALLSFEIERLQAAAAKKRASKEAAKSIFKS
jgi:uncharacterized small protein (DUF1192 family)